MRIQGGYLVHQFSNGKFAICKILDEVENEKLAVTEVLNLTSGKISEKELENKYLQKTKATLSE